MRSVNIAAQLKILLLVSARSLVKIFSSLIQNTKRHSKSTSRGRGDQLGCHQFEINNGEVQLGIGNLLHTIFAYCINDVVTRVSILSLMV